MNKDTYIEQLTKTISDELTATSKELTKRLAPELALPGEEMSRAEFVDYNARHWDDPTFRTEVLKNIGTYNFEELAKDVLKVRPPPAIPETLPMGLPPAPVAAAPPMQPPPEIGMGGPPMGAPVAAPTQPAMAQPMMPPGVGANGMAQR